MADFFHPRLTLADEILEPVKVHKTRPEAVARTTGSIARIAQGTATATLLVVSLAMGTNDVAGSVASDFPTVPADSSYGDDTAGPRFARIARSAEIDALYDELADLTEGDPRRGGLLASLRALQRAEADEIVVELDGRFGVQVAKDKEFRARIDALVNKYADPSTNT